MAVNLQWTPIMAIHRSAWNKNSANFVMTAFSWKFTLDLLLRNVCRNAWETAVL
jgi:hypothetical protein